jgi:hypothetical protein
VTSFEFLNSSGVTQRLFHYLKINCNMSNNFFYSKVSDYDINFLKSLIGSVLFRIDVSKGIFYANVNKLSLNSSSDVTIFFDKKDVHILRIKSNILVNEYGIQRGLDDFTGFSILQSEALSISLESFINLPIQSNSIVFQDEFKVNKIEIYDIKFCQKGQRSNIKVETDCLIKFTDQSDNIFFLYSNIRGSLYLSMAIDGLMEILNQSKFFPYVDEPINFRLKHLLQ